MATDLYAAITALRAYGVGCARLFQWTDLYTHLHQRDVATHVVCMGMEYGLEQRDLSLLRACAELHDIGKLPMASLLYSTSAAVLAPEGPEMTTIRLHPILGAASIESMASVIPAHAETVNVVANVVRQHHERWDGKGYPYGVQGTRITLMARMLSVADAAKAMTTPERKWRPAMTMQDMLNEIRHCAGTQFDPDMAEMYCVMTERNKIRFPCYE